MKKIFAMLLLSVSIFFGWKNIADAKEVGTISHLDLTLEVVQSDDGMKGGISHATGIYQKNSLYENSIFYNNQEDIHVKTISQISLSSKKARIKEFNKYDSFSDLDAYTKWKVISHCVERYKKSRQHHQMPTVSGGCICR